jgi:hypothetical protein
MIGNIFLGLLGVFVVLYLAWWLICYATGWNEKNHDETNTGL